MKSLPSSILKLWQNVSAKNLHGYRSVERQKKVLSNDRLVVEGKEFVPK